MPKSHFPARGGPQPAAWTSLQPAPPGENETPARAAISPSQPSLRSLEAENQRLRQELERARKNDTTSAAPSLASRHIVWIACALCGAAVLFALAALLTR